ncbi:PRC-barrel domain-containing protein [Evansella sp. AB-P1]|uniref:PRC-barrel domain-containing protein n=1 Tax=Evansella sp. AB-P1 TaxID=3037653 RepID=UPI0024202949|nr:PRC-barrel domain-containing protein [Evansella sp. AB-P1]MDG5790032.1 PRC-barrel domain-containing protein [Evansella sp. AB-P1]
MFIFSSRIQEFNVQATDGQLGKVKDIYFDEDNWVLRYLVIDTIKWLPGRKVLVSPISFDYVDFENFTVNIFDSKEEIKNSPSIQENQPVTRKQEILLNTHFGWPHYWSYLDNNRLWGEFSTPQELKRLNSNKEVTDLTPEQEEKKLRSVNEMRGSLSGYSIIAKDGEIGHVSDFIIDDENWRIKYFVASTANWLIGKFVVLSVDWIERISYHEKKIYVDLPKDKIKNGPFFELDKPFTEVDEKLLYESYEK